MSRNHKIQHSRVASSYGGGMFPEQHYGQLISGEYFYLRYRHGRASLNLSTIPDTYCWWEEATIVECYLTVTEEDEGYFSSDDALNEAFAKLLILTDKQREEPGFAERFHNQKITSWREWEWLE